MRAPDARVAALAALMGVVVLVVLGADLADAKPTIYVKNDNDKLEPVLVPVSSTVIPLPVYKVGFSLGATKGGSRDRPGAVAGAGRPDEPIQLITVHHKKKAMSITPKDKKDVGSSQSS